MREDAWSWAGGSAVGSPATPHILGAAALPEPVITRIYWRESLEETGAALLIPQH